MIHLLVKNKISTQVRFIMCKRTGLGPRFHQGKQKFNQIFWAWDFYQNMLRFDSSVYKLRFQHYSVKISGSENRIEFSFAALKPWLQSCSFAHNKPHIRWNLNFSKRRGWGFFKEPPPKLIFIFVLNFPLFIMYKGMGTKLRMISILKHAVFTTPSRV
jgi:hypothetical protein